MTNKIAGILLLIYAAWAFGLFGPSDNVVTVIEEPGARYMMIVRETADSSPELTNEFLSLRNGELADYLRTKHHQLSIYDLQKEDAGGKPPALLEANKPYVMPEVLIFTPPDKLLVREPFVTANAAIDLLKKHGG